VGATLFTTRLNVVLADAPSLSVAVTVTARLCPGPSDVAADQLHVPLALRVTVPDEAVRLTASAPGSKKLPPLVAVDPSLTVMAGLATTMVGARFVTVTAMALPRSTWVPSSSTRSTVIAKLPGPSA
jgi:hypothetical protein